MKEMIPLSLRQRKAFVWWARREYEDYVAIICDGAIRSGKTLAMGMGFFFWAMACFSDRQFALCGRSVGALLRPAAAIGLLLVCTAYLVDGSFNPFLYFRF